MVSAVHAAEILECDGIGYSIPDRRAFPLQVSERVNGGFGLEKVGHERDSNSVFRTSHAAPRRHQCLSRKRALITESENEARAEVRIRLLSSAVSCLDQGQEPCHPFCRRAACRRSNTDFAGVST